MTLDESRGTVLIADDEPGIRALAAAILRRDGIRTVEVANGREALESILREVPDAVLCDIRMPELDGMAVLRKVLDQQARDGAQMVQMLNQSSRVDFYG